MREYSTKIALSKNSRGIYSLDTTIGCSSGLKDNNRGCYNDCYAAKSAKLYGYDFSKTVIRDFIDNNHRTKIVKQISNIKLPFVRIGTSGDPSENWEHTVKICQDISSCNKEIVIITKHWNNLRDCQLNTLQRLNICINTSVSALDDYALLSNSMVQYERIKKYCKSVLRIVSCDFNLENKEGHRLHIIQKKLFENTNVLDTVLRVNKNNKLATDGIINIKESKFLGKNTYISKYKKNTYFGKCSNCHEMCGVNINTDGMEYPDRKGVVIQPQLFKLPVLK